MAEQICTRCQNAFPCTGNQQCWCMQAPVHLRLPMQPEQSCLCPDCLVDTLREAQGPFDRGTPTPAKPSGGLIPGVDYRMEQGKLVFSAWYLLKRGFCCGNGCRNCPYG